MAQPVKLVGTGTMKPATGTVGVTPSPTSAKLQAARAQFPQYANVPDQEFADALYEKFYTGKIPRDRYYRTLGIKPADPLKMANPKTFMQEIGDLEKGLRESAVQGITLGFSDEVGAAGTATMGSLLGQGSWGENYEKALGEERGSMADFQSQHPVLSTGAMLAGGLGIPVNFGAGASTLGTIGRMAGTGAGLGAAAGFGASDGGLGNRLSGAGMGAGIGAGLGAVLPSIGVGVSKAVQLGKNAMGLQDPAKKAADLALKAIERDKLTLPQVGQNMATTKPVMLADQGRNLQRLGRTVETVPGAGSERATNALRTRQMGQGERVVQDVRGNIANVDFMGTREALQAARAATAAPLYQRAFAAGPIDSPRVQQFLGDPIIRSGIARGLEIQRLESLAAGRPFDPYDYAIMGFDASGAPILGPVPNMRLLDAAKRGLDDILEGYRDPTTGRLRLDERGRAIDGVRRSYITTLDGLNADYAAARQAWAGPSQSLDAMAMGRAFARGDSEVVARTYQGLSPTDREFFKMGVVRQLEDTIMKSRDGWDTVVKIFGSKDQRARLQSLFDNPSDFMRFEAALKQEAKMFETQKLITGGSPTGRIMAEQEDTGELGRMAMDLASTGLWGAATRTLGRGANRAKGLNESTADELSKLLFVEDPAGRLAVLQALLARQGKNRAVGSKLANIPGRALSAASNVTSQKLAPAN